MPAHAAALPASNGAGDGFAYFIITASFAGKAARDLIILFIRLASFSLLSFGVGYVGFGFAESALAAIDAGIRPNLRFTSSSRRHNTI